MGTQGQTERYGEHWRLKRGEGGMKNYLLGTKYTIQTMGADFTTIPDFITIKFTHVTKKKHLHP